MTNQPRLEPKEVSHLEVICPECNISRQCPCGKCPNLDRIWAVCENCWGKADAAESGKLESYREALEDIIAICIDYDGYTTVEGLKGLIDDIRSYAVKRLNKEEA